MTNEPRIGWDVYFMRMANFVATRSTCDRKHVGAVIVRDKRVIASGYNGSLPGLPHCDDVGHDMHNGNCVRTVHAEVNAIAQAARYGTSLDGAAIYQNTYPCWKCFQSIAAAGIKVVIYEGDYRNDERVQAAATSLGLYLSGMLSRDTT